MSPASRLRDCIEGRDRASERTRGRRGHRVDRGRTVPNPDSTIDLTDIRAKLVDPAGAWPPADVVDVVGGVDQQANRLEVAYVGRTRGGVLAVLGYETHYGATALPGAPCWSELRPLGT